MPIPQFILDIRARLGPHPLPLPAVTAVVFDEARRVLLVQRADDKTWCNVTGILEPGEQPAAGAVREVEEETAVIAAVDRLVSVTALPLVTYPDGAQAHYLDLTFGCRAVGGEARVNDDESLDVGWFAPDALPPSVSDRHRRCIADALSGEQAARFEPGPESGHRTVPHTADLRIEAWGANREDCIAQALRGLVDSVADVSGTGRRWPVERHLGPAADADLLAAAIDEVIYGLDARGEIPVEVAVTRAADGGINLALQVTDVATATIVGAAPKAVALSGLTCAQRGSGRWWCAVTVDV